MTLSKPAAERLSPRDVKLMHTQDDVDAGRMSHHHTLGPGIHQAAPGTLVPKVTELEASVGFLHVSEGNQNLILNSLIAKDNVHDGRLNAVEGVNTTQDNRLTAVEGVNTSQANDLNNKQDKDATLTALAGVAADVDRLPYFNGVDTATWTLLTGAARGLLNDATVAEMRETLQVLPLRRTAQNITTTPYTFVITDEQNYIQWNVGTAGVFIMPPESSVPWTANMEIHIIRLGAGALTIQPGAGVTFESVPNAVNITLGPRYSECKMRRRIADRWMVTGGIV